MKIVNLKHITAFLITPIFLCMGEVAFCADPDPNDPNDIPLISLGNKAKKVVYLVEAVYWPDFDFKNVQEYIVKPDLEKKAKFTKLVTQIIDPNYLPEKLPEKIRFLKGWRGEARESFLLQYEKGRYIIRVKNQVTYVQVTKTRRDSSYWITIVIQAKDKSVCVNKSDLNAIFNFTDQFLCEKINSSAQNYSGVKNMDGTNMDKPRFAQIDDGYILAYPVGSSKPDIDGVCIWTDGHTVLINLKERRKVVMPVHK